MLSLMRSLLAIVASVFVVMTFAYVFALGNVLSVTLGHLGWDAALVVFVILYCVGYAIAHGKDLEQEMNKEDVTQS